MNTVKDRIRSEKMKYQNRNETKNNCLIAKIILKKRKEGANFTNFPSHQKAKPKKLHSTTSDVVKSKMKRTQLIARLPYIFLVCNK